MDEPPSLSQYQIDPSSEDLEKWNAIKNSYSTMQAQKNSFSISSSIFLNGNNHLLFQTHHLRYYTEREVSETMDSAIFGKASIVTEISGSIQILLIIIMEAGRRI